LIFVHNEEQKSSFTLLHVDIQLSQYRLLNRLPFHHLFNIFDKNQMAVAVWVWVLFCATGLHVCFCASAMLFLLLWLWGMIWSLVLWIPPVILFF
jgi:hypothetical protein